MLIYRPYFTSPPEIKVGKLKFLFWALHFFCLPLLGNVLLRRKLDFDSFSPCQESHE